MISDRTHDTTNLRQTVDEVFLLVRKGLDPFVEQELRAVFGESWMQGFSTNDFVDGKPRRHDPSVLLRVIVNHWRDVFAARVNAKARGWASELLAWRNDHAHFEDITEDDVRRVLDTTARLLDAIEAPEAELALKARDGIDQRMAEARRRKRAKPQATLVGLEVEGLKPWREVITPQDDVRKGEFTQAQFAANLTAVVNGSAEAAYGDPEAFFARTYLTEGLKKLLSGAILRLSGKGGEPIAQLQVPFGGGKTHSLLALWHLFGGAESAKLTGVPDLLALTGVGELPSVKRAVVVGTDFRPGSPTRKPEGFDVHTVWGEIAYRLLGPEGYAIVADDDRNATNPGDHLDELFRRAGPCLILIDEWVAYARQLVNRDRPLPGGDFETQMTFAQALSEAASRCPGVLVVVTLPESAKEDGAPVGSSPFTGGPGGDMALSRLEAIFARQRSIWEPATAEESFAIVRQRLFCPLGKDGEGAAKRAASTFAEYYDRHKAQLPPEAATSRYRDRIEACYPIHPALFDHLYQDWSPLPRFQRTRGVLKLMASVIHALYRDGDPSPMILPGSLPLEDPAVGPWLYSTLEEGRWQPVVEHDVAGDDSVAAKLDLEEPRFGGPRAARRAARSIWLATAPHGSQKKISSARIRLDSAQPGDTATVFTDAARRLLDGANHLYEGEGSYWFSPEVSLAQRAREYLADLKEEKVRAHIQKRIDALKGDLGGFFAVHPTPDSGDVHDDTKLRLVLLGMNATQRGRSIDTPAIKLASEILTRFGGRDRQRRNRLIFMAMRDEDIVRICDLARQHLAWEGIVNDEETHKLDLLGSQTALAQDRARKLSTELSESVRNSYGWILAPHQAAATDAIGWDVLKLDPHPHEAPSKRAYKRLLHESLLYEELDVTKLLEQLRKFHLLTDKPVSAQQISAWYAEHLYLYRLRTDDVVYETLGKAAGALAADIALADLDGDRLRDIRPEGMIGPARPDQVITWRKNLPQEQVESGKDEREESDSSDPGRGEIATPVATKFWAEVEVDASLIMSRVRELSENVLQPLRDADGVKLKVRLHIEASADQGWSDETRAAVKRYLEDVGQSDAGFGG